jgi:hypothetical protein
MTTDVEEIDTGRVYDFQWVTTETFDINKLSFSKTPIKATNRYKFLYTYESGSEPKELHLTLPLNNDAFVTLDEFRKDTFKKGTVVTPTNRYSSSFMLRADNIHHQAYHEVLSSILNKFSEHTGIQSVFPCVQRPSGVRLYTGVIQNSNGDIYTKFYTKDECVDILQYGSFEGRPAFCFSANAKTGKITSQVYQAYVARDIKVFPLAMRE